MQSSSATLPAATMPDDRRAARLSRSDYRTLGLSSLGGALEYYEFAIFIFLSPTLSAVMFPAETPSWLRQVQTLAIFAAGYLLRPFGGMLLAVLGDRIGRKRVFGMTLLLMAAPTLCIGLLPTYAQIGISAPLMMLACRLCQGLALGGELPTAATFIAEQVPARRLGFSIGTMGAGFTVGALLAVLVLMVVGRAFPGQEMASIGWRVPFLIGGIAGLVSAYLRRYVRETPVFEDMLRRKLTSEVLPFRALLVLHPKEVVLCLLASASIAGFLASATLFPITYLEGQLGLSKAVLYPAQITLLVSLAAGALVAGMLVDRMGHERVVPVLAVGAAIAVLVTFVDPTVSWLRYGFAAIGFFGGYTSMMHIVMVRSFPAPIRVTGYALTYNTSAALIGGLLPIGMTYLTHIDRWALVYVPAAFALIAVVVAPWATRFVKPMYEVEPARAVEQERR